MAASELPTEAMLTPIAPTAAASELPRRCADACSGGDAVHLVDQRAVVFLEPGHRGIAAARGKAARQPLQQPGAEGIEAVDPGHVDDNALDGVAAPGRGVDLRLQAVGVLGHPGAGAGKTQPLTFRRAFKQYAAHPTKPLISCSFSGGRMGRPPGRHLTQGPETVEGLAVAAIPIPSVDTRI